jgi:hypothetical protein
VSVVLAVSALSEFALLAGAAGAGTSTGAFNPGALTGLLEVPVAAAAGAGSLVAVVLAAVARGAVVVSAGAVGAGAVGPGALGAGAAAVTGGGAAGLAGGLMGGLAEEIAAGGGIKSMATLDVAAAVGSPTLAMGLYGLRSTSIAGVADRMRPSSPR